jgi:Sulfatase
MLNNNTIKILEKQGYTIHNHSAFDFKDYPSLVGTYFHFLKGMFISDETLFGRVKRDIGWNLMKLKSKEQNEKDQMNMAYKNTGILVKNINTAFTLAKEAIQNQDTARKDFFYFHFILPHDPFIFDSTGNVKYYKNDSTNLKDKYLDQLKYTNTRLIQLVTLIQEKYNKKAVIILQGDHGFKQWPGDPDFRTMAFENLNAVYLPDKAYTGYYNSVSSVNTFRLLFNHYFKANLELLPDKSVQVFIKPVLKKNYGIRQDNN